MNTFQTFKKYLHLKYGSRKQEAPECKEKTIIFLDNRFRRHFEQIVPFFESGFLPKNDTLVVSKFHASSFAYTESLAQSLGIKTHYFLFYRQLPNLRGKIILYPYNGQSNCRMVLNREAKHVFLTHGESNKKATINRLARIYDHVLACGDLSVDRYLEYEIFSPWDIDHHRVIKLGTSLIAQTKVASDTQKLQNKCILYMPTWEGGLNDEDFSSVGSEQTPAILLALCQRLGVNTVLFKVHPNLGQRIKRYKHNLRSIITALDWQGINVYYAEETEGVSLREFYATFGYNDLLKPTMLCDWHIKYGVVDVSAAEAMLAAKRIPTLVLNKEEKAFYAPQSYLELRRPVLLNLNKFDWIRQIADYVGTQEDEIQQEQFYNALISCSLKELDGLSNAERFAWMSELVLNKKQVCEVVQ